MTEYTIEITTYCPHNCNYCSTKATQDGIHIDIEIIKQFLNSNKIKATDRLNISGGEPLAHPKFWDILQMCKQITPDVWVYTNALTQIRYNTSVIEEIRVEANVCLTPGEDVYIPKNADKVHLLQLIPQGRANNMKNINVSLSGCDCSSCNHKVLQADGQIVEAPCKKKY
jgi:organic radical activating enzyme